MHFRILKKQPRQINSWSSSCTRTTRSRPKRQKRQTHKLTIHTQNKNKKSGEIIAQRNQTVSRSSTYSIPK
jgi:hypothetical protein